MFLKNKIVLSFFSVSIVLHVLLFFNFIFSRNFAPIFIALHILTIIALWIFLLQSLKVLTIVRSYWKEICIICLLILIAFFVRIDRLEEVTPGMYPDEIGVAQWGIKLLQEQNFAPFIAEGYYHPTPLLHVTGWSVETFGHTMTAIRLPSIIFGAFSIGAFYILLRLFFPMPVAFFGAMLMVFQYTHIVISRFAYESIPSLFWQIVTLIFCFLYWKKKDFFYLLGVALSLGAGMYTYLNFRLFAILIFIVTILLIFKNKWRLSLKKTGFFIAMVFVSTTPLISYFFIDPQGFSGRVSDISIFSYNYNVSEFTKELSGNIFRITVLPFFELPTIDPNSPPVSGDPNPRHNPATKPMFDLATVILSLVGLLYIFIKNRNLFWLLILLFLPPLLSDVFAHERIPEFHYPGIGHPHAMRTSGFIITTLFTATAAFYWIYEHWSKKRLTEILTVMSIGLLVICYWNWHLYFNQNQVSPGAYFFNYKNNYVQASKTAHYLNTLPEQKITITKNLVDTINFKFFIDVKKQLNILDLTGTESAKMIIEASDITVIDVTEKTIPLLNSLDNNTLVSMGYTVQMLKNPIGQPEVIIVSKNPHLFIKPSNLLLDSNVIERSH